MSPAKLPLDMEDRGELLELLVENARYATADLARMTDRSEDEVESAIAALEDDDIIRGYQAVINWDRSEVERARAQVQLNVTLDRETGYEDIARRIAGFPEVRTLQLVSGDYDFLAEVEAETIREISHFVSERIAPVPEITQTVTHFVMETYKEQGVEMTGGYDDDDRLSISP